MPMDLIPRNKDVDGLCINYGRWAMLVRLLIRLGADVSCAARDNSGDEIPAKVANGWAKLIEDGLAADSIKVELTDSAYVNGQRTEWLCGCGSPLSKVDTEWLSAFARFCRSSGGIRQY